jgi:hypothetical protein
MNRTLIYAECTPCAVKGVVTTNVVSKANALPTTDSTGWLTDFGLQAGAATTLPMVAPAPGRPPIPQVTANHFCPACVAALGMDKVKAAVTVTAPAASTDKA